MVRAARRLDTVETATTQRVVDGRLVTMDGPFAETKEMIAGYFILKADNRDEAIELAKACPHIDVGTVEIREMMDIADGPPS